MASFNLNGFFGGPPGRVLLQLLVLSLIVGFVLSYFELTPFDLFSFIKRSILQIWRSGFAVLGDVGNWLVVGAVIVVPLFLLTRLFASRK